MLLLVACSPKREQVDGPREYSGNLVHLYANLLNNTNNNLSEKCDLGLKDSRLEIAKQLEKRKSEIRDLKTKIFNETKGEGFPVIKFGHSNFYDNSKVSTADDGWRLETSQSWYDVIGSYEAIKNDPTNSRWVLLDRAVRSRATDDYRRIQYWINYSIRHDDEEKIKKLSEAVQACLNSSSCTTLEVPGELSSWAYSNTIYSMNLIWLENSKQFKYDLKSFSNRLNNDRNFSFSVKNRNHKVDKKNSILYVHLDMSLFGRDQKKMADLIEDAWSKHGLKIKVLNYRDRNYSFFKFVVDPVEARAYVRTNPDVIALPPYSFIKTVVHEIGHVLGLRDEYYTNWDESTCGYYDDHNPGNIMSESSTGEVLPKHVETIKSIYF